MPVEFTQHARTVLAARAIPEEWVLRAVAAPEATEAREDGTRHYLLRVPEREGRTLRVIARPTEGADHVVTAFFGRRMKGRLS